MDSLERNIALALILGRLEAAQAVVHGLEHKVFGISAADRQELEPNFQRLMATLSDTIHAVIKLIPEGEKVTRREN